ncbi:MAG: hypothetical protein WKF42_05175 [Solirubrobacteraceae bacterium]
MSALPLAHTGHWLVNVLYLVPLLVVIGMLAVSTLRDRRAAAAESAERPVPDASSDDSPASPATPASSG